MWHMILFIRKLSSIFANVLIMLIVRYLAMSLLDYFPGLVIGSIAVFQRRAETSHPEATFV
jgi:hypothetical protein